MFKLARPPFGENLHTISFLDLYILYHGISVFNCEKWKQLTNFLFFIERQVNLLLYP